MSSTTADQPAPRCGHALKSAPGEVAARHTNATIGTALAQGEPETLENKRFNGSRDSAAVLGEGIAALTLTPDMALRTGKRHSAPSGDPITTTH
jgi:hypothetical protein